MHMRGIAVMTVVGLLSLPALADAASQLRATHVRIGNHRAYVRVVVDFNGRVSANQVVFDRLWRRRAALHIERPGIATSTSGGRGQGVHVALQPATQGLNISVGSWARRFKYVSYAVVGGNRLAIDLWKSTLRGNKPIHTCSGLAITGWSSNGLTQTVVIGGHEFGVFENQFQVVVRGANGKVLGRRTVTGPGHWRTRVRYHLTSSRPGTVEAVALSAKDGALECLAQQGVELAAS
jgi:hypothetical protein